MLALFVFQHQQLVYIHYQNHFPMRNVNTLDNQIVIDL